MGKGSLRELGFEAGRAVPVYPLMAAVSCVVAASAAVAAGGLVGAGPAAVGGFAVIGVAVAVLTYRMVGGRSQVGKNIAAYIAGVTAGYTLGVILSEAMHAGQIAWMLAAGAGALWLIGSLVWFGQDVLLPGTSKGLSERREAQAQRCGGMAGRLDVWELASRSAGLRLIKVIRPSFNAISRWDLWVLSWARVHEVGILAVRFGLGLSWVPWHRLFIWFEQTTLMFGGPRIGKTLALARMAYKAPGALITTSTRSDLAEWVQDVRSHATGWRRPPSTRLGKLWWKVLRRVEMDDWPGRAVHVWNPAPEIQIESTVRWSVLSGCEDYDVAKRRANDMIPDNTSDNSDAKRWDGFARVLLGVMMYCARITNRQMRDVYEWLGDQPAENDSTNQCAARREIEAAIDRNPDPEQRRILTAIIGEHYSRAKNTRASVTFTATQALAWLAVPKARDLGDCRVGVDGEKTLDMRKLFEGGETLHIIGPDDDPSVTPLNRCLLGEVAYQFRSVANAMPQQRMDPPTLFALDEAGLVAQAPLHRWTADIGGRGGCIVASFQSESQMAETMGSAAARVTMGNANNVIYFGGSNEEEGLTKASNLSGEARFVNIGEDHDAADSHRWAKVISTGQLRAMRKGEVFMFRAELRPVRGKSASILDVPGARRVEVKPRDPFDLDAVEKVLEKAPGRAARVFAQMRRKPLEPVKVDKVQELEQVEEVI